MNHTRLRLSSFLLTVIRRINIFAICYGIFISIFLPFPSFQPVTWGNMNYGGPLLGAVIVFALCDWVVSGR